VGDSRVFMKRDGKEKSKTIIVHRIPHRLKFLEKVFKKRKKKD